MVQEAQAIVLTLSNRVWILTERLYIHAHKTEGFLNLLRGLDIDYPGEVYPSFEHYKNLYIFMSEENYAFANFMCLVSSYKYIPLLEKVVFDPEGRKTQKDNWNYYGEYIRNWYPELLGLLNLAGIRLDTDARKLEYQEEEEKTVAKGDFLPDAFGDMFLDYMRKEVNECYKSGLYLSVMFLSRKILESTIIRVFEVVSPKLVNKQYSEANHKLWYDRNKGRYHSLWMLLENLEKQSHSFQEDRKLIEELVGLSKPLRNETNACVHSDYKVPDETYISQWRIPYLLSLARKVFRKYCNP